MLVEAQVSSMNTSRSGSRSSCPSNQASRRLRTSGRSCSAACAVFFTRDPVPAAKAPERTDTDLRPLLGQARLQLRQGDVGHLVQGRVDQIGMGLGSTGRRPVAWAGRPRQPGASPASGWHWTRSRQTGSPPDGRTGPRRWRPKHESEGRRIALWAYRSASLASPCPQSDRPRFGKPSPQAARTLL